MTPATQLPSSLIALTDLIALDLSSVELIDCALLIADGADPAQAGNSANGDTREIMLAIPPRAGRHPVRSLVSKVSEVSAVSVINWVCADGVVEQLDFRADPLDAELAASQILGDGLLVAEYPLDDVHDVNDVFDAITVGTEPFLWFLGTTAATGADETPTGLRP